MFLIVSNDLTSKELEYISKIVLLREFENCIDFVWDRLPEHIRERAAATAVWPAMKAKTKMGMGLKTKKRKSKRILPIAKRGGILPVLPLLGVLGSLVGGAAGVAKAVNDSRAAERQLEEMQRHNRVMEGHGVYLAPYKRGRVVERKKKRR
ncbi:hypothetical protein ALC62_02057 [Cyphomyrmex costatus]|uniref:Uncharacterized protein n=1 Tax=Cyphomyrmex costatus TaxID=456900 RepID=A0A151INE8_9HYME|nr:hypothetical protein ALC62_02057 [Cyphomyrmex costatus]